MKKILCSGLIILSAMFIFPLLGATTEQKPAVSAATKFFTSKTDKQEKGDTFRICDMQTDTVSVLTADEYIFGVVAAEMPALYEPEALKAQAVAAYTLACRRRADNKDKSYDLTTDYAVDQSYISKADAEKRWGDKAEEYSKKIKDAVADVKNLIVTYEGEPITAVYHAISSGKTEDSRDIWGGSLSYLKPVASPGDKLSPDYISEVKVSAEELQKKLGDECKLSGEPAAYFGEPKRTDSGSVLTVPVCGTDINGAKIRSIFDLRSLNFSVKYADGSFTFTVRGYGHGVGMSQYGANYMAKQGSDFKEILTYYYTDCKVERL